MATLYPCEQVKVEGELVEYTNPPPEGKPKFSNRKTCAKCLAPEVDAKVQAVFFASQAGGRRGGWSKGTERRSGLAISFGKPSAREAGSS